MEDTNINKLPLLGDKAPEFTANTTQGTINFPQDYEGSWVILFSHPADFTPVCTTEFITFASMEEEFAELNTKLIGLSIDSTPSHIAWLNAIEDLEWKDYKNIKVNFPVIDDITMDVAKKYGMIQPNQSKTSAVRAVFVIDPKGIVRTILYYPLSTGRNFDEIKRIIQALQKVDKDNVATPADWRPGDDAIVPAVATQAEAKERIDNLADNEYSLAWFLTFRKDK
ncbi:peroxiredoxin [Miniphocaeibacter halophilus]|uniref:Peroxiredoxin n=1 Tax=Miniphocaeibacter halophilus TaxID=2931922 RepID=A0AC61MQF5_9FIRM|nr:peroxiredoxin [Miniphocaeibacter halophilus]QQK07852.1 peroxiredoxin [Miniphocaeibacter halophilus]